MNQFPSVMSHQFSRVPQVTIERSKFNRSHRVCTTFDAGLLIPFFVDEALPGDTFNVRMSGFGRLATPLKPVMDNMYLETFFFAVPNRLLWDDWEKFMGAKDDPADPEFTTEPPYMDMPAVTGCAVGSLSDYLGIPTGVPDLRVRSWWHRAYALCWNTWFRDQNLQDSVVVDKDAGPDTYTDYVVLPRGKRHDYFTSCLPWAQKGDAVTLPLGGDAPVKGIGKFNQTFARAGDQAYESDGTRPTYANGSLIVDGDNDYKWFVEKDPSSAYPHIRADLSNATAATVNELREALQLQVMLERDARGGTRYIEVIRSHFGVTSPDARLQRPEYLGGGTTDVNIHPVPMTGMASGATPAGQQGNLAGFGTVSFQGHGFNKSFTEHCVIIGMLCVRADLTYSQGLDKMFDRLTKEEYFWPALSHLGEQVVKNKEIWAACPDGSGVGQKDGAFGYQERYAEYRYKKSMLTGLMRVDAPSSLSVWHLSQDFAALPTLGADFIKEDPPVDRVIAVPSEPHFIMDGYLNMVCARPMPVYGVPTIGDRL